MRRLLSLAPVWLAIAVLLSATPALAQKRVALVIGNSAYRNVAPLPGPVQSSAAIAKMFRDAGFTVLHEDNVDNLAFRRAIRRFGDAALDAEMVVVYYAGHGIEVNGANYLIPVDAKLANDRDAADEAVPLDRLMQEVEDVGGKNMRLRLILLDACRDNPFARTMRVVRQGAARVAGPGRIGAVQPTDGSDMLVAYAAKAGQASDDGDGSTSPFTEALLRSLTVPGLDIRLAFGRVRDDVLKSTNNKQEPFVYGSLGGDVVSLVAGPSQLQMVDPVAAKADYDLVAQIGTRKSFEIFLNTYKTGFYADLARQQLAELEKLDQQPKQAANAPLSTPVARPNTEEQRAWSRLEGTTDIAQLRAFVRKYPSSPQAILAQNRVEVLQKGVREREEKAAAEKRAEDFRKVEADKQRLEREVAAATSQRTEEERRFREAKTEADRKAAEAAARRADDERRAKIAELERVQAEERRKKREEEERLAFVEEERKRVELGADRRRRPPLPSQIAATEPVSPPERAPTPSRNSEADEAWRNIESSMDVAVIEQFVARYPNSIWRFHAEGRIRRLKSPVLPDFPWPPPAASTSYVLPRTLFKNIATIGQLNDAIVAALEQTGYVTRSFFRTPSGGVALVTQLERINNDGSPRVENERWPVSLPSQQFELDLPAFLKGLFFVERGRYRVTVFIMQEEPFTQSTAKVEARDARQWLQRGTNVLPPQEAARPADQVNCTALIYEFASDGKAVKMVDSRITGRQHLAKAGILPRLEKPN